MSEEAIPQFGRSHDPDDVATRNIGLGGLLRRVAGTPVGASISVTLHESNTDAALAISTVAYDATKQRVSFRVTGGTRTNKALDGDAITMREGYRILVRVPLADGRHYDQSAFLLIRDH